MPARPQPVSVTDELLVHVLDVLGEIRDRLPAAGKAPEGGAVDVSEPAKPTPAKKAPSRRTTARGEN